MGLVDYVINEWNRNNNSTAFKIALGKREAKWEDASKYNFVGLDPFDSNSESILESFVNDLVWTVYIARHPIQFSQAFWYSLIEFNRR
ncbi:MAG: hypothetical protein AABX04_04335 [Nanoarchaeota archaeon]